MATNSPTLMFKGQTFAGLARSLLPTALLRFARQAGAGELLGKEITNLQGQLFLAKISYRENILMPDIALFGLSSGHIVMPCGLKRVRCGETSQRLLLKYLNSRVRCGRTFAATFYRQLLGSLARSAGQKQFSLSQFSLSLDISGFLPHIL